ncbi:phage holin family protein [soil metagenome]|jgi:putative membrane protein
MRLLVRWLVAAAAVGVTAALLDGVQVQGGVASLLAFAAILGLVNALVRPLVKWLSCGLIALTLGLFLLVINAAMLLLAVAIGDRVGLGVTVDGFGTALVAALLISVVTWILSILLPDGD